MQTTQTASTNEGSEVNIKNIILSLDHQSYFNKLRQGIYDNNIRGIIEFYNTTREGLNYIPANQFSKFLSDKLQQETVLGKPIILSLNLYDMATNGFSTGTIQFLCNVCPNLFDKDLFWYILYRDDYGVRDGNYYINRETVWRHRAAFLNFMLSSGKFDCSILLTSKTTSDGTKQDIEAFLFKALAEYIDFPLELV